MIRERRGPTPQTILIEDQGQQTKVLLFPQFQNSSDLAKLVDRNPVIVRQQLNVATPRAVQWRSLEELNILITHGYTWDGQHRVLQNGMVSQHFYNQLNDKFLQFSVHPWDLLISCQEVDNSKAQNLLTHTPVLSIGARDLYWHFADGIVYIDLKETEKRSGPIVFNPFEDLNHSKYSLVTQKFKVLQTH